MWRVHISWLPFAEYLALVLAPPLRLDHLARLGWAVEAGFSGEAGSEGWAACSLLARRGGARSTATAEDGEQGVVCTALVRGFRGPAGPIAGVPCF